MWDLKIGTCSWKYDSWRGLVYEDVDKKNRNYLEEYAERFDTVEVDQWFWSLYDSPKPKLPDPWVVEEYAQSVPEGFRFTVKVPNSITLTHHYRKSKDQPMVPNRLFLSPDLFDGFLKTLEPIKEKLGVLMFQFEYLNRQKMPSQMEFEKQFAAFLSGVSRDVPLALELRNPNYLNRRHFDFLERHNLLHVFMQGYYMPDVVETYRKYRPYRGDTAVVRLMGPDRKKIEEKSGGKWMQIFDSRDAELERIVAMLKEMAGTGVKIFVNVNNHYEGSAPLTIQKLKSMLNQD
jgi:uncharacterized protein YecE (DUF72 family)